MALNSQSPFSSETIAFLEDLETHNNREWFQENQSRYEQSVLEPALDLIRTLEKPLAKLSPMLDVKAKRMGGSLMRIYRDTRFSPNKNPYKTNVGIHFRHTVGRDVHAPGLYIHIQPKQCFLGAGMWMPDSPTLAKLRASIDQDPKRWNRVTQAKAFRESFSLDTESIKTSPRGYDKEHPMIDFLRRKSHIGMHKLTDSEIASKQFPEIAMANFKAAKTWMVLLCDAIGLPF